MSEAEAMKITITTNGPYRVTGGVPLAKQIIELDAEGQSREWRQGQQFEVTASYDLCRCGNSGNKPFCDGSHVSVGFSDEK
jgi:CDGSH-type Zn-finger protein